MGSPTSEVYDSGAVASQSNLLKFAGSQSDDRLLMNTRTLLTV
ncbi:hypothetical protein BBOR36S_00721 [Brevibacillus borstelensis]|jgi:hypothetical protein